MKWCIEQFVKKICSPIICKTGKGDVFFMNGEECAAFQFDKKYEVRKLVVENNKVVLYLEELSIPNMNWTGEDGFEFH